MTDPISRLSRTLAVLRQGKKAGTEGASARARHREPATNVEGQAQSATPQELRADIIRRLRAIDPEEPNRRGAAVRIFIERVLLHELGGQLERSPRFHSIVADVQRAMEEDEQVRGELQALVVELEGR